MEKKFLGSFTQQQPLPESAIEAATKVMRHGRLHRYNVENGEISETALFEQEFARQLLVFVLEHLEQKDIQAFDFAKNKFARTNRGTAPPNLNERVMADVVMIRSYDFDLQTSCQSGFWNRSDPKICAQYRVQQYIRLSRKGNH